MKALGRRWMGQDMVVVFKWWVVDVMERFMASTLAGAAFLSRFYGESTG